MLLSSLSVRTPKGEKCVCWVPAELWIRRMAVLLGWRFLSRLPPAPLCLSRKGNSSLRRGCDDVYYFWWAPTFQQDALGKVKLCSHLRVQIQLYSADKKQVLWGCLAYQRITSGWLRILPQAFQMEKVEVETKPIDKSNCSTYNWICQHSLASLRWIVLWNFNSFTLFPFQDQIGCLCAHVSLTCPECHASWLWLFVQLLIEN